MLTLTERAKAELKNILHQNQGATDDGLRLILSQPGDFALMLDKKQVNDKIVEDEGRILLLYQKDMARILDNIVLDCQDTEKGKMLVISK